MGPGRGRTGSAGGGVRSRRPQRRPRGPSEELATLLGLPVPAIRALTGSDGLAHLPGDVLHTLADRGTVTNLRLHPAVMYSLGHLRDPLDEDDSRNQITEDSSRIPLKNDGANR